MVVWDCVFKHSNNFIFKSICAYYYNKDFSLSTVLNYRSYGNPPKLLLLTLDLGDRKKVNFYPWIFCVFITHSSFAITAICCTGQRVNYTTFKSIYFLIKNFLFIILPISICVFNNICHIKKWRQKWNF